MTAIDIANGARIISRGGVVAYPTEACFGIGCDPANRLAVKRILKIKERPAGMGFILIADNINRLLPYLNLTNELILMEPLATWPGPYTWIFPANLRHPARLAGKNGKIAVRVTAHPLAARLCMLVRGAIVSTSANRHRMAPIKSYLHTQRQLGSELDFVVRGPLGNQKNPTSIRDAETGATIRAA